MAKKPATIELQDNVIDLLNNQIEEWPLLRNNYEVYDNAPSERIYFNDLFWEASKVLLNYRKASLSANLQAIAKGQRPCFLCKDARPSQQRSILWNGYEILANPYPASDIHFTIVNRDHTPQHLGERILDMAGLAHMLESCCIFYNGPRCGASAPDHMHFQAVDIEEAINFSIKAEYMTELGKAGKSRLYAPHKNMSPFGYYLMDIKKDADIPVMFEQVLSTLPCADDGEPMMNVIALQAGSSTRIAIIPRRQHRPSCYGTAPGQMLVSPASLEMMGKFITSTTDDYERLDEQIMTNIYHEVGYTHEEFTEFINRLPK